MMREMRPETPTPTNTLMKCLFPRISGEGIFPRVSCFREEKKLMCLFPRIKCLTEPKPVGRAREGVEITTSYMEPIPESLRKALKHIEYSKKYSKEDMREVTRSLIQKGKMVRREKEKKGEGERRYKIVAG